MKKGHQMVGMVLDAEGGGGPGDEQDRPLELKQLLGPFELLLVLVALSLVVFGAENVLGRLGKSRAKKMYG